MYSSQEVRYIVIEVLDGMVENIQEHASSLDSYTETLLAWPPTQIATKEELLWCRMLSAPIWKDNPHELLMDESKVYMKEGMNYITEEEWHCEEQTVKIYS